MSKETCSYYYIRGAYEGENNYLVQLICDQLDEIDVEYTISYGEHLCGMCPAAAFIEFKEEQNRAWISQNVRFGYPPPAKEFKNVVTITSENLIECDNWLLENFGFMEDEWTADCNSSLNTYYFKEDTDAMAFKLKFS